MTDPSPTSMDNPVPPSTSPSDSPSPPTTLFRQIETTLSTHTTLGPHRWYLLTLASLTGLGRPELAASLYTHLTQQPQYTTPESRQALVRRLREALVKCVSIIGVPRPLEAIFSIATVESPPDRDHSFSRADWSSGPANRERGTAWLSKLYQGNLEAIWSKFDAHKDFAWITTEITYGLYLSDHAILDEVDTEVVVLSGIMVQDLRSETGWHLRGMRRVGVSKEEVEVVQQCVEMVVEWVGVKLGRVPRVGDIEHEV